MDLPSTNLPSTSWEKEASRDPEKPKKAMTSYMCWMEDFQKMNSQKGWTDKDMMSRGEISLHQIPRHEVRGIPVYNSNSDANVKPV